MDSVETILATDLLEDVNEDNLFSVGYHEKYSSSIVLV